MGDSAKLPDPGADTYRFTTHRKYLDAFVDAVIGPAQSIVMVVHDWGSALGFRLGQPSPQPYPWYRLYGGDRAPDRLLG